MSKYSNTGLKPSVTSETVFLKKKRKKKKKKRKKATKSEKIYQEIESV